MKNFKKIMMLLILFGGFNANSFAGSPTPPTPPAPLPIDAGTVDDLRISGQIVKRECDIDPIGWDWNSSDSADWKDFSGANIVSPWSTSNHSGMDLSTSKLCHEDGWRLYKKRLTCADWFGSSCDAGNDRYKEPNFALYNIHTGQLRTFIHFYKKDLPEDKIIIKLEVKEGGVDSKHGIMLTDIDRAIARSVKDNVDIGASVSTLNSFGDGWSVVEHSLSYDWAPSDNTNLRYTVYGTSRSQVSLQGSLSFTIDDELAENDPNVSFSAVWDEVKNASRAYKEPLDWAYGVTTEGQKIVRKGRDTGDETLTNVGNSLLSIGGALAGGSTVLGAINAGASLIGALNSGSTRGFQTLYGNGEITLDGDITSIYPKFFFTYGVHKANQFSDNDSSDLDYNGDLGLFTFYKQPKFNIIGDGINLLSKDLRKIILVNPASMMELVGYRIAPMIYFASKNNPYNIESSYLDPGAFTSQDSRYNHYSQIDSRTGMITMNSLVHPDTLTNLTFPGYTGRFDAKLKVYMLFRHKLRSDIYVEAVRVTDGAVGDYFANIDLDVRLNN